LAVFVRGQLVVCVQVSLQHREVFATLKANEVIAADRSLDINGRFAARRGRRGLFSIGESAVDIIDQFWKVYRVNPVVCHVCCNNLRSQAQHRTSAIGHRQNFLTSQRNDIIA
jgi:hypothetical protein